MRNTPKWFLLLALPSCDVLPLGGGCPDIGCVPNLSVTFQPESGALANGQYALRVVADGSASAFDFSVPPTLPDGGTQELTRGGENGDVNVMERSHCVERRTADAVSLSCTPIPNSWFVSFSTTETPARIDFELRRGDQVVLDETLEPTYVEQFPAGPGCGGGCLQAEVALTLE